VGFLITSERNTNAKLAQRLKKTGCIASATITKKQVTSSGSGRDLCYLTYEFQARQASAPNASVTTFSRKIEVPDGFFDTVTEGQTMIVLYDPADPSVSTSELLIRHPRSPAWLVWTWWVGMATAFLMLLWSYVAQARRSRANSEARLPGSP
jgi:hypothetical protein